MLLTTILTQQQEQPQPTIQTQQQEQPQPTIQTQQQEQPTTHTQLQARARPTTHTQLQARVLIQLVLHILQAAVITVTWAGITKLHQHVITQEMAAHLTRAPS